MKIQSRNRLADLNVIAELKRLGVVFIERITSGNLPELSVRFARYKSPVSAYGWDRTARDGDAFSFALSNDWRYLVSSVSFSHLGKHTPFLFVDSNHISQSIIQYIQSVKPLTEENPPYMHGFIVGSTGLISKHVQAILQNELSKEELEHM